MAGQALPETALPRVYKANESYPADTDIYICSLKRTKSGGMDRKSLFCCLWF